VTAASAWGGVVKLWFRQKDTVKRLEDNAKALAEERIPERVRTLEADTKHLRKDHIRCAATQAERYKETREQLHAMALDMAKGFGEVAEAQAMTQQKLDDLIKFTRNGGKE